MKLLKSIAPYVRTAFLISVGVGMWALSYNIGTLKREIHNIYTLHIYQAQQIDMLLNIQLREGREVDQEWLLKTREKYKDINK
tara:strand:+ start:2273 stop:2521 length:249 start_codon:yes stop_codon:yes gene_type:complete